MAVARGLGQMYSTLGCGPHQRVRNPFPMRELVKAALPRMSVPTHDDIAPFMDGRTQAALNRWKSKAKTVNQIMADLQARGFIVNKAGIVMALHNTNGVVARRTRSYRLTKRGHRYVSIALYALSR